LERILTLAGQLMSIFSGSIALAVTGAALGTGAMTALPMAGSAACAAVSRTTRKTYA